MKYYRFPDNKLFRACFMLFLLAVQILARSTMFTSVFIDFYVSQFILLGLIVLVGVVFVIYNRGKLKQILTDRRMIAVAAVTLVTLGSMVIKQDWQFMYFSILLCMYLAIFLNYFLSYEEVSRCYVLLMTVLAAYSVLGQFVLKPLALAGVLPRISFDSPGGWHMFNFGLTFPVNLNNHGQNALRNFGIFREPGLYQAFLFVAIQLNNYTVNWDKQWKMWAVNAVLCVTLLTTFATGGVFALALYAVFLFFDKGLYRNKKIRLLVIAAVIAGIALVMVLLSQGGSWAYELVGMVEKVFLQTESYTDRVDSVVSNVTFFLKNPIVGEKIETVLHAVTNNTASSAILFAIFGIGGAVLHVASWAAWVWKKERCVIGNLILMVIMLIPFNTQNVIYDMFFWLFPTMALVERGLPMLDKLKKKGA